MIWTWFKKGWRWLGETACHFGDSGSQTRRWSQENMERRCENDAESWIRNVRFWCRLFQVNLYLMADKRVCRCRRCSSRTHYRLHLICIIAAVVCVIVVVVIVVGVVLMLLICYR